MIMSTLGRKVFSQTELEQNLINAWWIECKLQIMRINGLVKMIEKSKKLETSYIDGYLKMYKWALRPETESINIINHIWFFEEIQHLEEDFPWNYWSSIVQVDTKDALEVRDCIKASKVRNVPYILAIFNSRKQTSVSQNNIVQSCMNESNQFLHSILFDKSSNPEVSKEWENLKNKL